MSNTIRGMIFDLDGTIVDSMGIWYKIDLHFLKKRGISVPKGLSDEIKDMTFKETAKYFKQKFNLPEKTEQIIEEWNDMAYFEYANNVRLKPGVYEYLLMLKSKNVKIGLATSNCMKLTQLVLHNNNILQYFDVICTTDEIGKNKRFPDIYLLTALRLGLKAEQCAAFEDILAGILSAKKAGMKTVGVYDKYSAYQKEQIKKCADYFIYDFYELMYKHEFSDLINL